MLPSKALQNLKEQGYKITEARKKIVKILLQSSAPISAQDIIHILAAQNTTVNKTTVYREIFFLTETKLIQEITFKDGIKRYEAQDKDHHHHLVCISCGSIKECLYDHDLRTKERKIKEEHGFTVLEHSLEFFGICKKCQTK